MRRTELIFVLTLTSWIAAPRLTAQSMEVYSKTASVERGTTRQFSAYVPLSPNTIQWQVNGVPGGSGTYGTVTSNGLYQAPAVVPMANVVKLRAQSTAYPAKYAEATITITQPALSLWSIYPTSVNAGAVSISLNGNNFQPDSVVTVNGAPVAVTYVSKTALRAAGNLTVVGRFPVVVSNPGLGATVSPAVVLEVRAATTPAPTPTPSPTPSPTPTPTPAPTSPATPPTPPCNPCAMTLIGAGRFLEQASFGPRPADLVQLQQNGYQSWLNSQFGAPETPINLPPDPRSMSALKSWWMYNATQAPDQLRQKMMYALGQIWVISANKNIYPEEMTPWLKLLSRNAFGNYRNIIREMTISPSMGKFLDLANSAKPGVSGGANENYPREVMQLFTIGLYALNMDGSMQNVNGIPLPAYSQQDVKQVALGLTGWTYPTLPGRTPGGQNWEAFHADMEARQSVHDITQKTFLNGCVLPANQTVVQDLDGFVDCLFQHPNLPPFVATRLIRSLVASNPSPAYIGRIASVFANNGAGVRGDLKAVVQAILIDPEARQDTPSLNSGRLREPLGHTIAMVRALNGQISQTNGITYLFVNMAQPVLTPPSVFNWFSPAYRIPKTTLFGPEFQIYSPTEAVLRANWLYSILSQPNGGDVKVDLSPFTAVAADTAKLIDAVDQALLYGRMSTQMRGSLAKAINASTDNAARMLTAVYLTATSGEYVVQH